MLAVVRADATGEVVVDGAVHPIEGENLDDARARCMDYVFTHVVGPLGRAVRVEARDSETTRHLYLHPDADVTEAPPPAAPPPSPRGGSGAHAARIPTLEDLLTGRPAPAQGPAMTGWRATLRKATGGPLRFPPSAREVRLRDAAAAVQRSFDGPRTIVVINPKGGAHKTTATLLLAATFGTHRGGYTLAWDNNETRGTLGWRAQPGSHHRTAVDLLRDLDRFTDPTIGRVGDLDSYVRSQGDAQFDALASDEDAASAASIDDAAFEACTEPSAASTGSSSSTPATTCARRTGRRRSAPRTSW